MSASTVGTKRRWAWAAGGAVMIAGALVGLFSWSASHPLPQNFAAPRPKPAIELAERREKSALDDEATLLDPTPLFQPTRWNTAQLEVARPEPSGSFESFRVPPKFGFADSDLRLGRIEFVDGAGKPPVQGKLRTSLDLPAPVAVPATPTEVLAAGSPGAIALGFGRVDQPLGALPARGALVDIGAVGTGQAALPPEAMARVQALAAGAKPPAGREWQAMEFLAAVDPAGLSAPLTLTTRSGADEVDAYFQNFLVHTLRVGERLAPGFYRISVGP